MSIINGTITLTDYKSYATAAGQTMSTDATDDGVIEDIIESTSRYIEDQTQRTFYPRIETRYLSIPDGAEHNDTRLLVLDDDLLALTTLTNGDATAITSGYNLLPKNETPYYAIRLKDSSSTIWETDSDGESEYVISVLGWWGYHNRYAQRAWSSAGTLGAAQSSTTSNSWTMTSGHSLQAAGGQIVKIDSEILITSATAATTLTSVARGENGSTAATHTNGSTVYLWNFIDDMRLACLEIVVNAYHRRFGQNLSGVSTTSPAGVVISPADITATAAKTIAHYARVF